MQKQALEGLKVIGFTYAGVGNRVLRTLAEYGATVVIVESITRPNNLRLAGPFKDDIRGINRSGYFAYSNHNKYSIALNIKHPRSVEVTKRLVSWTDILVENFAPGAIARWNLSYEDVKKINPSIIMVSLSSQGQTGPHSLMPGYGPNIQGLSGFVHLTGWPDRGPDLVDRSYPDFIAPRFGLVAILAALDHRRRTGKGQYIDISEYENCVQFLTPVMLNYTVNRVIQTRKGNKSPYAAPHGAYRCSGDDRWCVITVLTDAQWEAFCRAIGNPAWTNELRFSTLLGRKKCEDELDQLVEQWTVNHTAEKVMTTMQEVGVPAGVVRGCEDTYENCPQLEHRQYFTRLNHEEMGEYPYPRASYILSKTPAQLRMPAPGLGEHTEYVCKELLSMPEGEFVSLLLDEVFE